MIDEKKDKLLCECAWRRPGGGGAEESLQCWEEKEGELSVGEEVCKCQPACLSHDNHRSI